MGFMKHYLLFLAFVFSCSVCPALELGNSETFAIRFDDRTGVLTEILSKGEIISLKEPGTKPYSAQSPDSAVVPQFFDVMQDADWIFHKNPPKLVEIKKESDSVVNATYKLGDWTVMFRYSVDIPTATLGRNVELTWNGKEPTKLKNFWMAYPTFPFETNAEFFVPAQYPPKKFTPDNFPQGARQGSWKDSAPLVFQLDKTKSVILLSDNLIDYADRPSSGIERRDGGVRLTQSFDVKGHVKPGLAGKQYLGVGYLKIVDGDSETALLKIHDLMRRLGHVVPKDRPKWFESAILYSFHPGGTIGSGCKDLGGFVPATKLLDRIKELGCNAIWLMPLEDKSIYHPRDYYKFQDGLGSTPEKAAEEYRTLVKRAHELGLKVLQDNVPHGGSNTNDRAKKHPEWLVQEEDGSTLDYWCFDFNWPSWIDYMADVSRYYVKEYDIDGYRVDACGGSKIPNWNPAIPYSRASHSQSQGGFNMLRAIRKAVKDQKPDGAILAEVNGSIFGAVSDAVYDFDLCYSVLQDSRKQTPEEFVKRLRRWLHEQQYSDIPDLLRLRHVESHDSLRGQLWYGVEPHRALVALTAFIHGIPLVYHEQEDGNFDDVRKIFSQRNVLPELQGGDADYLAVDVPPGVFAVLRTKGDDACIAMIDFRDKVENGTLRMPLNKLPSILKTKDAEACYVSPPWILDKISNMEIVDDHVQIKYFSPGPFGVNFIVFRKNQSEIDKLKGFKNVIGSISKATRKEEAPEQLKPEVDAIVFPLENKYTAYIDPKDGLLALCNWEKDPSLLGKADLFLPPEYLAKAEKPIIVQKDKEITVHRKFGNATLEIVYSNEGKRDYFLPCFRMTSRWTGTDIPPNAAINFSVPDSRFPHWNVLTPWDFFVEHYQPRHLTTDGVYGSIYWRPQGTNVIFDSLLTPFYPLRSNNSVSCGLLPVLLDDTPPARVRILDRIGEKKELSLLVSWTDETAPRLATEPAFTLFFGLPPTDPKDPPNPNFRRAIGGWIYENDHYRLRISRSGTITSLDRKVSNDTQRAGDGAERNPRTGNVAQSEDCAEYRSVPGSLIRQGDLYTDYGYSDKKMRYAAADDVEAACRIVQDGDVMRLRFEGQLRHNGRFDLLRPPVEYFIEYALGDDSAFDLNYGVKTSRMPTDNKGFLAAIFPMDRVETFEYFKDGKSVATGTNVDAKGRSPEYRLNEVDAAVLRSSDQSVLLRFSNVDGDAASKLFLDRKNFFVTFDDRDAVGPPNRWRSFAATVFVDDKQQSPKRQRGTNAAPLADASGSENSIIADGGFENSFGNDLVSLRTGVVLKGDRKQFGGWQTPQGGSISVSEKHSGSASAQVVGEIANYRLFAQDLDAKAFPVGSKLKLTAWVKGDKIEKGPEGWQVGCIRFAAQIGGKMQYYSSPNLLGTFDWKQIVAEFAVPEKLERLTVQVGLNGASGTLWIDDVEIFVEQ